MPRPFIPGMEVAGTVEAVGEGVTDVSIGDGVAYAMNLGAYAENAIVEVGERPGRRQLRTDCGCDVARDDGAFVIVSR